MVDQKKLDYISSYISKLLRKNFGRGPHSCQTSFNNKFLVTFIRGFVTPMEEVLLNQGHSKDVDNARTLIMEQLLEEIKGVVQVSLETEVNEYYHDWNYPNNSGVIVIVLEKEEDHRDISEIDVPALEKEIGKLSLLVEKVPDQIYTYPITPNIYVIERIGILVPIEKALLEKGYEQELRFTKDELEKSYFHRDGRFQDIFHKDIRDIFIDWNFKENKSIMVFLLNSL